MPDLSKCGIHKGEGKYHEEAIYSLALLYSVIHNEISFYLNQFQLTLGKFNILMAVEVHGKGIGIRQVEISNHLIVTPSNMTKLVDKLENEGLVSRSALEGDRRVNLIRITPKGKKLLDSLWEGYDSLLKKMMGTLTKEQQKQLSSLLVLWFEQLTG